MQLCNELCCRVIDDGKNIFVRIETNIMFLFIWLVEAGCQFLIVLFTGPVFNVAKGGISPEHWGICIAFSFITFPVNLFLKYLPDVNCCKKKDDDEGKSLTEGAVMNIRGSSNVKKSSMSRGQSKTM